MKPPIKSIIFDVDGVLLRTKTRKGLIHLGIYNILRYIIKNRSIPTKAAAFKILAQIPSLNTTQTYYHGTVLPPILADWQKGLLSNQELLKLSHDFLDSQFQEKKIRQAEYSLVKSLCTMMFTQERIAQTRSKMPRAAYQIAKIAAYAKEKGIQLYILSNWDKESFPLVQKKFPEIFIHFNPKNIMISGNVQLIKPSPEIFQYFLETYHLKPEECLFIDDEAANIKGAQYCGILTLHCTPKISKNLYISIIYHNCL